MNIKAALLAAAMLLQPVIAHAADWLDDVPAAAGLHGCKRDAPSVTAWHCASSDGPHFNPRTGELAAGPRAAKPAENGGGLKGSENPLTPRPPFSRARTVVFAEPSNFRARLVF